MLIINYMCGFIQLVYLITIKGKLSYNGGSGSDGSYNRKMCAVVRLKATLLTREDTRAALATA